MKMSEIGEVNKMIPRQEDGVNETENLVNKITTSLGTEINCHEAFPSPNFVLFVNNFFSGLTWQKSNKQNTPLI